MTPDLTLTIENGFLRPLNLDDAHQGYVDGMNDPAVNRYLDSVKCSMQTMATVRDFIANDRVSTSSVLWGIWMDESVNHIGTVRLHGIEHRHGTAHIGVCLFDRQAWGRKIGSMAIGAVTRWAISDLGLRWIEAGAYEANLASQKAFMAAGYSWVFDIPGKYLLDGQPTIVKVYAARA